jgi:threonine dehydrogenase-like Zn-dependent dehydrogenase
MTELVPGDIAVVIGAGPIGIMIAQTLKAQGASVVLSDVLDWRLELAAGIGDFTVVNPRREDYRQVVEDLSQGRGAGAVIEAAGTQSALEQAFDVVGLGGTVVTIGTFRDAVKFNPFFRMIRREVRLVSSIGRTWETWRRMTQLIRAGCICLDPLISHVLPMEQYEQAFKLAGSESAMKVLLRP